MIHGHLSFLALLLLGSACSTLPSDQRGRGQVYERRLSQLEFPVSRQRLYQSLPPRSRPERVGSAAGSLLASTEVYRLDDWYVLEISVLYQIMTGGLLSNSGSVGSQVRAILDTTQSLENLMSQGTPEHRADIIERARLLQRPMGLSGRY